MNTEKTYENEIKELLGKMTLEEKAGQLQQCGPSLVGAFDVSFEELLNMMFDGKISKEKFDELMSTTEQDFHEEDLRAGKIGSYNGINNAKTANRLQKIAVEETRLGIPLLFGYDVIHGYRTVTPIPLAESCAWEPDLWRKTARMSAEEATAAGIHMTFAPMVDVAKDARWGRVSEGAGEDVLLNTDYGVEKVKGYQGDDLSKDNSLAACVKHFAAYGAVEGGRDYNRVDMSLQKLFEEYMPAYKGCIDAGAAAVMPAFNDINGVPCSVNQWLLTQVLRDDWKFDGMTVSDSNAIAECVTHGFAADRAQAAKAALEAGVDMDMSSDCYIENIVQLIKEGKLEEKYLDRAVADILRTKYRLGLFENPYQTSEEREKHTLLSVENRKLAREAAQKSIVLLKNDGILPLKKTEKAALTGELADNREQMTGAWAIGADGNDCISLKDGLDQAGITITNVDDADIVIAAIGETKEESGEAASRSSIEISKEQQELVKDLADSGKKVIAVLFNGRPLAIGWLKECASAIVEAWHPGIEAGNAICDILFGEINPSAKLTTTFPNTSGQCPMYYSHINTGRPGGKAKFTSKYLDAPTEPVYPFGYGLSYSEYEYSDMKAENDGEKIILSAFVKNTGERAGEEIVQCYFKDPVAQRVRPVKQLVAYKKVAINPGEKKEVIFEIEKKKLGYYDANMNYIVEPGEIIFYIGKNSEDCLEVTTEI